jgi:hypothetical protein
MNAPRHGLIVLQTTSWPLTVTAPEKSTARHAW